MSSLLEEFREENNYDLFDKIPSEIGRCHVTEKRTSQGIAYTDWDMYFQRDMHVEKKQQETLDVLQIIFFLNRDLDWEMGQPGRRIFMNRGEVCIYRDKALDSAAYYPGGCDFSFKSVQIPMKVLRRIMGENFNMAEQQRIEDMLKTVVKATITPAMQRILLDTGDSNRYCGGLEALYLEGKTLELFAACLETTQVLGGESKALTEAGQFSRGDREIIMQVKRLIDADSANVPDCGELAKQAGISVSKLAKGFKLLSGTSLHSYVIERRLEYAAFLLEQRQMNVSQAAVRSGYSNMSHFSEAFRKKYGVLPRDYR